MGLHNGGDTRGSPYHDCSSTELSKPHPYIDALIPALKSVQGRPDAHQVRHVTDADEEVFYLYTLSAAEPDRRGLGQIDDQHDALCVDVDWSGAGKGKGSASTVVRPAEKGDNYKEEVEGNASSKLKSKARKGSHRGQGGSQGVASSMRVTIRQDVSSVERSDGRSDGSLTCSQMHKVQSTSLRSTNGDTGSVVWRSSVSLATKVITDFAVQASQAQRDPYAVTTILIEPAVLGNCRILELGAGTGIVPCLLLACPLLRPRQPFHWLATDQAEMMSLLRKNMADAERHANGRASQGECASASMLDWLEASQTYNRGKTSAIERYLCNAFAAFERGSGDHESARPDIILATDCIFNPSLFAPFVDTLNLLSLPVRRQSGKDELVPPTLVLLVCELRESDALREFIETWLRPGRHGEQWCVYAIEDAAVLGPSLARGSVVWAAWRTK